MLASTPSARCLRQSRPFRACAASRRQLSVSVKAEVKVGDYMKNSAEYFRVLRRSDGGSVSLSSFQGKQPVVLFFYPKAGTPGCTKEACAFRDSYKRFEGMGAAVFGISSDSPEENAAFAKANNLQFPLLSDSSSILRKVFGIKGDLLGLLPGRETFVIATDSKVVMRFNDQFQPDKHVDEALAALRKLPAATKA